MVLPIRFSQESEETFESVIHELRQRWGEKFVAKFKAKTIKSLNTISNNPYLYAVADLDRDIRKCVLHSNCSVFYKIQDQYIMILYFWDNRQDPLL
jgi:plasmid stabilization system protein ParE